MSNAPDSRSTSAPGESRNANFADSAAKSGSYQAPHGFDVQAWIDDADTIEEARGWRPEDYDD